MTLEGLDEAAKTASSRAAIAVHTNLISYVTPLA